MTNKKERAIVLGATANMTFALANTLIGIKKHSPDLNADFIVYHKDITQKEMDLINSIIPCEFIDYEFPEEKLPVHSINRYSRMSFARYECFNMLDEYKKVLWLDIDILVQKDLSGIFDYAKTGMSLVREATLLSEAFSGEPDNYDMSVPNRNSGILLISDKLTDHHKMYKWLYNKTFELANMIKYPDQAILNIFLQEFNIECDDFDEIYNYHPTKKNTKKAVIVHPYSPQKFWMWYERAYHFKEWDKNNKEWIKMGGSQYDGPQFVIGERWLKANIDPEFPNPWRQTRNTFKYILKNVFGIVV